MFLRAFCLQQLHVYAFFPKTKCGVKLAGSIVCGIYLQFKSIIPGFCHALYVGQKLTGDPLSAKGFIHNHGIQMEDISCFLYRIFDMPD